MKNAVIICLFMCLGCGPVKRLERLQKKHPELFKSVSDTFIKIDTFIDYDTFIDFEIYSDTVTEIDTLTNQTILRIHTKSIDKIIVTKYVNKYITVDNKKFIQSPPKQNWGLWLYIALALIIFAIIWKIFK